VARADIPPLDEIRDRARLEPLVRRTTRETWFDPDWLWSFAKGMQDAGLPTETTLAALERQRAAHRLALPKRLVRLVHLKAIKGYWDY
jgi:hypothetical protein